MYGSKMGRPQSANTNASKNRSFNSGAVGGSLMQPQIIGGGQGNSFILGDNEYIRVPH